jgi:hypothetical protein
MAELDWAASEVTQEHLQNLMSQGYMIAMELATCRVSEDPTSPTLVGGYVVVCMMFYKRGFDVPSHRFLCFLLQFYGLNLHHMTPSGTLHMAALVTPCEAYMGIEPHFVMRTTSSVPGYNRTRTRKWWCWAVLTYFSDPGSELIPTFTFHCPTLRSGGGKYGSFRGTMQTRHCPCSRVAALSLNPNGGMGWPKKTSTGYNPCVRSSSH